MTISKVWSQNYGSQGIRRDLKQCNLKKKFQIMCLVVLVLRNLILHNSAVTAFHNPITWASPENWVRILIKFCFQSYRHSISTVLLRCAELLHDLAIPLWKDASTWWSVVSSHKARLDVLWAKERIHFYKSASVMSAQRRARAIILSPPASSTKDAICRCPRYRPFQLSPAEDGRPWNGAQHTLHACITLAHVMRLICVESEPVEGLFSAAEETTRPNYTPATAAAYSVVCKCKAERSALCSRLPFGSPIRMEKEKRTQRQALLHPRISNAYHAGSQIRLSAAAFSLLFLLAVASKIDSLCSLCCWAPCFGCVLGAQMCNL